MDLGSVFFVVKMNFILKNHLDITHLLQKQNIDLLLLIWVSSAK